jgi:hypothetical protein
VSLVRPLFLLALLALPVLWLLSRRVWQRRVVVVSSLLVWSRLALAAEPPLETRRRADRLLLLRLAAAAILALGLAGPTLTGAEPPARLFVVLDDSPSMRAFEDRSAQALDAVRKAAGGAGVEVIRSPGIADLAMALALAGEGDVIVITDHPPPGLEEGGRVRIVLVGEPVENVGIVSAWIEEGEEGHRYCAVIRNFADRHVVVEVQGPKLVERLAFRPGGSRLASGAAPDGRAEISISPGDRFAFDDRVEVALEPARTVRAEVAGEACPKTRLALEIAGIEASEVDPVGRILVHPPGERRPAPSGTLAAGPRLAPEAVPAPETPLGPASVLAPGGEVLLADADGPLAVLRGRRVEVALDPGDPASGWAEDPAFPIFWAEVARLLGARPARSVVNEGTIAPEESATRPVSGPWRLDRIRPTRAGTIEATDLSPVLFLVAAAVLILHLLLDGRRKGPVGSA